MTSIFLKDVAALVEVNYLRMIRKNTGLGAKTNSSLETQEHSGLLNVSITILITSCTEFV